MKLRNRIFGRTGRVYGKTTFIMRFHNFRGCKSLMALSILLSIIFLGCSDDKTVSQPDVALPSVNHDLSYIPFDADLDDPQFVICDSNAVQSGRNRLRYVGGIKALIQDCANKFNDHHYESFSGYIVVRFLFNCEDLRGRYRVKALNMDFSRTQVSPELLTRTTNLVKDLNKWERAFPDRDNEEYMKYVNLMFKNGRVEHVSQ